MPQAGKSDAKTLALSALASPQGKAKVFPNLSPNRCTAQTQGLRGKINPFGSPGKPPPSAHLSDCQAVANGKLRRLLRHGWASLSPGLKIWPQFRQRQQHKGALVHPWMGQLQINRHLRCRAPIPCNSAKNQQIKIQNPWSPAHPSATAQLPFNVQKRLEQGLRPYQGTQFPHAVEEDRLPDPTPRIARVKRRRRHNR